MIKFRYLAIGVAALLLGACSDNEPQSAPGADGNVTVTLLSPEGLTRSAGEASAVNSLKYAVFDITAGNRIFVDSQSLSGSLEFPLDIDLKLLTGHQYGLLFWSGSEDAPYEVDLRNGTMTVNYDETLANSEALDAFYAYQTLTVNGNSALSVTMERPFALVSIGSSTSLPEEGATSSITIDNAFSSMNLFTGELSEPVQGAFGMNALPSESYPVTGYSFLAYAYVLAPANATPDYSLTYSYKANAEAETLSKTVTDVTLQANYRTNIYGSLPQ